LCIIVSVAVPGAIEPVLTGAGAGTVLPDVAFDEAGACRGKRQSSAPRPMAAVNATSDSHQTAARTCGFAGAPRCSLDMAGREAAVDTGAGAAA
jgi:hypothetical protein